MGDYKIVLSSDGNVDLYPGNKPSAFTNKLQKNIKLDTNTEYEVGLREIYFSKHVYSLLRADKDSSLFIYGTSLIENDRGYQELKEQLIYNFTPSQNILAGEIGYLTNLINSEINLIMIPKLKRLFPNHEVNEYIARGLLYYDRVDERESINLMIGPKCSPNEAFCVLKVEFGNRLAAVLGFDSDKKYQIYGTSAAADTRSPGGRLISPYKPDLSGGLTSIQIYSDIVVRTPYAGQMVNILDITGFSPLHTKSYRNPLYYNLSTRNLDEISIRMNDQLGRNIEFTKNSSTICVLHIRPKNTI